MHFSGPGGKAPQYGYGNQSPPMSPPAQQYSNGYVPVQFDSPTYGGMGHDQFYGSCVVHISALLSRD